MAVKTVDEYIARHPGWEEELYALRDMMRSTQMEETIKWGSPVYTVNGKNVVSFGAFKNHCALWFFQGALLKENTALLLNAQDGKTKAMRQIRLEKGSIPVEDLRKYVKEAIRNQQEGKTVPIVRTDKVIIPDLMASAFESDPDFKSAFLNLSPGKQREYCQYISEAKQDSTKLRRMEKINPMIKEGTGLHDKYK